MIDLKTELEKAAKDLIGQGHESIPLQGLLTYLDKYEADNKIDSANALAELGRKTEIWKVQATVNGAANLEMFKAVIEAGGNALRAGMLINGGASIALLAFLGNAIAKDRIDAAALGLTGVNQAMLCFFLGTACAGAGYMLRYITQYGYHQELKSTKYFHCLAVIAALASLTLFVVGGVNAYRSFAA